MVKSLECFACGICIGPDYDESIPYPVGDKNLCSWCRGKLKMQGYIQVDRDRRLLPNGSIIQFHQKVNEELGEE